ncbi:cell division protein FtsW [bacterium]|nr:cell division protein FtsW [bacterium]
MADKRYHRSSMRSAGFYSQDGDTLINPRGDRLIVISALLLTAVGLVMVYSASTFVAAKHDKMDWFFMFKQLKFAIIGLAAFMIGAQVNVRFYKRWVKIALLGITILMFLQLVTPLGAIIGGTRRWINLGLFNLQTSEVARCLVIIYLARTLAEEPEVLQRLDKRMFGVLAIVAVPMLLTAMQPDLSGALMMAAIVGIVLFLGGLKLVHILGFSVIGVLGTIFTLMQNSYQRERLFCFLQRFTDVGGGGDNYQAFQSLLGFGRGGLLGVGLGQGKQKMLFLPEPHTDFIFSIIGEELGLIRTTIVLALFIILTIRALKAVKMQPDRFKFLLGAGLTASIIMYALVNMYVTTGMLPVTGLPLPFISSGGTNLVISLWSIGVLWNLSRYTGDYV